MKEIPIPRTVRVSRRKMRAFLVEGIDVKVRNSLCYFCYCLFHVSGEAVVADHDVQYGYEINDITYSDDGKTALAQFTNGESASGTIVLGADGPRSKVRSLLLGEKGNVTPLADVIHANVAVCYNDATKAEFVRSAHPVFSVSLHPELFSFISSKSDLFSL